MISITIWKNKAGVGMMISGWMITDEMKLTEIYRMYATMFGVDVPTNQSQPTESTQGTHRTTSAPSSPNPDVDEGDSSAQRKYTIIRLRLPPRRSTRLTPPTPILTATEVYDITLRDTIQLSIAEQKSHDELEAKQNVEKVEEHLIAKEIEKLVEGTENVENDEVDNSISNIQNDPGTRIDPGSYKESLEVEKTADVQPVNAIEEEEESTEDDYELRRRFLARQKFNVLAQHLQEIMEESLPKMVDDHVKEITMTQVPIYVAEGLIMERQQNQVDSLVRNYMSGHTLHVHPNQASQASAQEQQYQLYLTMKDNPQITSAICPRDQDDPHDNAHSERENSAKRLKTSEHGTYVFGESLSGQVNKIEPGPSTSVDEEKLRKVVNEMLQQRCSSGDEHQYHIDQMQNFLKNDIMWESRKEILTSPFSPKPIPVVQSCQRDPKAPALSLVNQDLLYLKKGNSGPKKIVLSLHKFLAVIFPDDDIEERTSRWKPHAKIFYIKRQKEPGKPKEEVYSNSKILQVVKTYGELGHEHKFVTEIIARRANGSIISITEPDYKNLNKNDIEDMYLLCINGKLGVESYQQKVNLTAPTITFPGIEKYKMFSIVSEPVYGIIYKNSKKEKRVMRHQEIHKFCDATLKRVLEGLKSYNNDVKHGYVTPSLSKEDAEYLQLFEEEIEERLKHRDQMRWWEMYVNERPLGSRREHPE
ncbi:hypothetical protein Tco_0324587 [Tanacetum coccineum]